MKDPCLAAYESYTKRIKRRPKTKEDSLEIVRNRVLWGNVIPMKKHLQIVADQKKHIIELGSGLGYFANKLSKMGVEITAVDISPYASSDNNRNSYLEVTGERLSRGKLWIETVEEDAVNYLLKNNGCRDTTLLMLYPPTDPISFLWQIDWKNMFKGDCIIYAISEECFDERLSRILLETGIWTLTNSLDMPKYNLATSGLFMQFRIFSRKK